MVAGERESARGVCSTRSIAASAPRFSIGRSWVSARDMKSLLLKGIGAALEHAHAFCRHHGVAGPKRRVVEDGAGVDRIAGGRMATARGGFVSEALILATNWE